MKQRVTRSFGRLAVLAVLLGPLVLATGSSPPSVSAGEPTLSDTPVLVGFYGTPGETACLWNSYTLDYYVSQYYRVGQPPVDPDDPLAPLEPADMPDQVEVAFTARHGAMSPTNTLVGPFVARGQLIVRTAIYRATSLGTENLTIKGTTAGGTWKNDLTFEVVKCTQKVRGTVDMTPVTSTANQIGDGLWTMVASLDVEGEAEVGEGSVTGSGTVQFFMHEQFEGVPLDVFTCAMTPPWQGAGELTITGDAAALAEAQLALTLDMSTIPLGSTRIQCTGDIGGGGFDLPAGDLPAQVVVLEPMPMGGATVEEELSYAQFQLPFTISVVQRVATS